MKYQFLILITVIGFWVKDYSFAQIQSSAFDPLLDSECEVINMVEGEQWNGTYMWYPGQLSAHMQNSQKQKSEERCTYVGYPGKFNEASFRSFFRKTVHLKQKELIKWSGPESITLFVDGKELDKNDREYILEKGSHFLFFDVASANRLPCLIVAGKSVSEMGGWQVSLDNKEWCKPETDAKYNKPSILPDSEQEIVTRIFPNKYILLRNVIEQEGILELGENSRVIIDFRHLEVGNVKLNVKGSGRLSFFVGESPEEVLNDCLKDFEQLPIPCYSLSEQFQNIILPERALRYLRIESEHPCVINNIHFDAKVWPVDFQMLFECNDPNINSLWNAGVATLHTSLHNFYLDGVKRDYLPWSMDAIVSSFAGDYLFGENQVSRNGLSIALMPPKPETSDLGIIDYPLHALIGFKQNYMRYGDIQTSLLFKERIIQMLALYESIQDENGFISDKYSTSGFIPGWARRMGPDIQGIPTYGQIMLYQNYMIASNFAKLWNEKRLADKYEKKAKCLRQNILNHFWDDEKKAFINGYMKNGEKDTRISHHAQYWAVLADLYPSKYYDKLFDEILPNIPYYKEDISYEKGYEFLAYVKAGRIREMFSLLNLIWGDWLRQGYTRFPENFSYDAPLNQQLVFYNRPYGLSLCHGANGVPPIVAVLYGILGFGQSDFNLGEYHLKPELLDLDWVKGRIPVKEGYINYSINKIGESFIEIPKNCVVYLKIKGKKESLIFKKAGKYKFCLN